MTDCMFCRLERDEDPIYRDADWSLWRNADAPGWVLLAPRRHVTSAMELNEAEQASLGPTIARVAGAVRDATGAERVYFHSHGEQVPHLHLSFQPRVREVPPQHRGPRLALNRDAYAGQPERTSEIAAAIAASLG